MNCVIQKGNNESLKEPEANGEGKLNKLVKNRVTKVRRRG